MDTQYVIFRLGDELYGAAIHDVPRDYPSPTAH